jgi:hydroxyacylglutathione hydrolase
MLDVSAIPAFTDNYLWLLTRGGEAVVVDPGDAAPVLRVLKERDLKLVSILITHWHPDHIGGVNDLLKQYPVPVYGPRAETQKIPQLTVLLDDGDHLGIFGQRFDVLAVPGHTLGHIAYYTPGQLFCGDTLFSAGCGRLFEGTPQQMHSSLSRLAALPEDTLVYCTHEYTLSNLAFAVAVEPGNAALHAHLAQVREMRAQNQPSLPSTLKLERAINPFLRAEAPAVVASATQQAGHAPATPGDVFAVLRRWKDNYKTPADF